jgi:hypothetical protein
MTQSSPPGGGQAEPGAQPSAANAQFPQGMAGKMPWPAGTVLASGASASSVAPRDRGKTRLRQLGWAAVPVCSVGFLAFAPSLRLAIARRRQRDWAVFGGYLLAVVAEIVAVSIAGNKGPGETWAGGYVLLLMGVAAVHAAFAFGGDPAPAARPLPGTPDQRNQAALATARSRMEHRHEAREIASKNPVLARELRIGRPDLPRDYDDGGLVDVNQVPGEILQSQLGLSPAEAAAVVAARGKIGSFSSVNEVTAYAQLPPDRLDDVGDWMIFG